MTLFDNATETNLRACAQMVEAALSRRNLDPAACRLDGTHAHAWRLRQGSAEVHVSLTTHRGEPNTIQVVAPVLRASETALASPALFRRLLELNASGLTQAAFGVRDSDIVLTADRSTTGLDTVEVEEMIRRIADYADHYDDTLVAEFGGTRHSDLADPL
ncbi:MAG: YbjN domain-containing protein [Polyangia bacterium]